MYSIRRCMDEWRGQNGPAQIEVVQFNCRQQILSPLLSVLGSPGHETIAPVYHGTEKIKVDHRDTRVVPTSALSAARRTSIRCRLRPLASQVLIPTGSLTVTVPALRQGTVMTQKNPGGRSRKPSNFSHLGPKFFCVFTQYTDVRTR